MNRQRAASAAGRQAQAHRLGALALVTPDLDRSLLLAVQAVRTHDDWETRGDLLAVLGRSPQALRQVRGASEPGGNDRTRGAHPGRLDLGRHRGQRRVRPRVHLERRRRSRRPASRSRSASAPRRSPRDPTRPACYISVAIDYTIGSQALIYWDARSRRTLATYPLPAGITGSTRRIALSTDRRVLAVPTQNPLLLLYDRVHRSAAGPPAAARTPGRRLADRATVDDHARRPSDGGVRRPGGGADRSSPVAAVPGQRRRRPDRHRAAGLRGGSGRAGQHRGRAGDPGLHRRPPNRDRGGVLRRRRAAGHRRRRPAHRGMGRRHRRASGHAARARRAGARAGLLRRRPDPLQRQPGQQRDRLGCGRRQVIRLPPQPDTGPARSPTTAGRPDHPRAPIGQLDRRPPPRARHLRRRHRGSVDRRRHGPVDQFGVHRRGRPGWIQPAGGRSRSPGDVRHHSTGHAGALRPDAPTRGPVPHPSGRHCRMLRWPCRATDGSWPSRR